MGVPFSIVGKPDADLQASNAAINGYARIDDDLKDKATAILDIAGLTVSGVIRVLLTRITMGKIVPAGLFVPNAETVAAMEEAITIMNRPALMFNNAREMFSALEVKSGEKTQD